MAAMSSARAMALHKAGRRRMYFMARWYQRGAPAKSQVRDNLRGATRKEMASLAIHAPIKEVVTDFVDMTFVVWVPAAGSQGAVRAQKTRAFPEPLVPSAKTLLVRSGRRPTFSPEEETSC